MKISNEYIEVIEDRQPVRIRLQDILFAEVYRTKCIIHLQLREVKIHLSIDALYDMINSKSFIRCHRSYIANLDHIKAIRVGELILDNGVLVPISRRKQKEAQNAFDEVQIRRAQEETKILSKMPAVFNNKALAAMKAEFALLENEYWDLRAAAYKNPCNRDIKTEYLRISGRMNEVVKAISDLQSEIVSADTTFNEKVASGISTSRLKQARKMFNSGDIEGTKQLLDFDEMVGEDNKQNEILEEHQRKMISKVSEYIYLADILKTDINNPDRFFNIKKVYRQALNIEIKHSLPKRSAAYRYSEYLLGQTDYKTSLKYARQHLKWLESGERANDLASKEESSEMCVWIAECYMNLGELDLSEQMHKKNLEILNTLQNEHSDKYEALLAMTYNNLADLYFETHRYDEVEELLNSAMDIRKRLAEKEPGSHELGLIESYANLGYLYTLMQRYDEGEIILKTGLNVCKQTTLDPTNMLNGYHNNAKNQLVICNQGITYNNLAYLYDRSKRYPEAVAAYNESLTIFKRLADENPAAYEHDLALAYNNLAMVYSNMRMYKESDELYSMCIPIYDRLAKENESTYDEERSAVYGNYADLLRELGRLEDAEEIGIKSLEIRETMSKRNPDAYEYDLAISLNSMALIYKAMQRYDEALSAQEKAVAIQQRLVSINPLVFQPKLLTYLINQADLYKALGRGTEAEEKYKDALAIAENLKDSNTAVFEEAVERINTSL